MQCDVETPTKRASIRDAIALPRTSLLEFS